MIAHKVKRLNENTNLIPLPGPGYGILFFNSNGDLQKLTREDNGVPQDVDSGGGGGSGDVLNVQASGYAGSSGEAWVEYDSVSITLKVKISGTTYDLMSMDR